jgi:hypothetical protein
MTNDELNSNDPMTETNARLSVAVACLVALLVLQTSFVAQYSRAQAVSTTQAVSGQPLAPREVFMAFFTAMSQGDAEGITPICYAGDDESRKVVGDLKDVTSAIAGLRKSVSGKFGDGMTDLVLPIMASPDDGEATKQTITGDKAILESINVGEVFLINVDGQWKMDIPALLASGNLPGNAHSYFMALAQVIRATIADIDKGRFDSAFAAREGLRARQEGIREDAPTTQPAEAESSTTTRPTTMP